MFITVSYIKKMTKKKYPSFIPLKPYNFFFSYIFMVVDYLLVRTLKAPLRPLPFKIYEIYK